MKKERLLKGKADKTIISYSSIRTILKHLNRDFYHRIRGYIQSKKDKNELVEAPSVIHPEETIVECDIMYLGLRFIFPIKLSNIPHVGETINFDFHLFLPI